MSNKYAQFIKNSIETYKKLLEGAAPEQARFALAQGMYTEWYWTGSLLGFNRVYRLRSQPDAQWEVQQYADAIGNIMKELCPVSWDNLNT